jgi:hypothetical protein
MEQQVSRFSATTLPLIAGKSEHSASMVTAFSQMKYGKQKAVVEQEIVINTVKADKSIQPELF